MAEIEPETNDEWRNFVIVDKDGNESGSYKGKQPRQAAMKVARTLGGTKEKPIEFSLRERGVKHKLHKFTGYVEEIKTPPALAKFIKTATIKKPHVKKLGVEVI
ncbi:MAG: non-histone chromosomal MC1 family protein [Pedobacter sp.]|uniref:non-histone chromosomal MC1 family protein n=1 Tax=Pedobacter sp. TaxID=1411316 RepID=UPI003568F55E